MRPSSIVANKLLPESWEDFVTLRDTGSPDEEGSYPGSRLTHTCCTQCNLHFSQANVHTSAGWAETQISGLCEDCFDGLFEEEEEEDDDAGEKEL